ncbi:hypothetical protein VTN00DRAFT_10130 [Thermoascus crustaceus]|uniref:uncharacterized protein n=1 Tax=Thermoascus crustaceus TaxID=5088 RepID=UPI003743EE2E
MVKSILRTLLATCLTSAHFVHAADYGVGFDLSLDYGRSGVITDDACTGEEDDDDPAQLILKVDYTRAALTALVVFEDCGVFEHRRVLHDTRLDADGLGLSSNSSRDDLARALRDPHPSAARRRRQWRRVEVDQRRGPAGRVGKGTRGYTMY